MGEKEKEELKKKRKLIHTEEVKGVAARLQKAYDYLLQARRELTAAEEALQDAQIRNLERKVMGEKEEEDLKPLKDKITFLKKKVEEAEQLVRLIEGKAKRVDPKFFDFL
jgi:hypothetical protein